ncbi:hypothetical protein EGW08_009768 [Elysia chlorotica]|uniref:protein-serine/threonine phosphatase n=1 Tax=Elysia chlorotica TaxID=188477 RepID=A0A3S1B8N6_ELYCH|nr:hypothetical protein EGW08_009768 [Elysia chlorotica]
MGQTLSEPVTTKFSSKHENSFAKVGSSCMQGWRISILTKVYYIYIYVWREREREGEREREREREREGDREREGGGASVAQYAGNNLHKKIVSQSSYSKGNFAEALRHGFLALDEEMLKDETMKDELAGTTAVVVLIKNGRIYCANVGDSRAVSSVHGEVEQLSFDHKPSNESETRRIIAAGGWVEFNRVNGNLALSRALGDFVFKKNDKKRVEEQIVTANPDVIEKPLTSDHEFMVLACDGIWDVLTNQEVVEFVRNRIAQRMEICEELMTRCLAPDCQAGGLGCDNMTVVLVCFLHGGTYDDLVRKCARPSRGGPAPHLRDYNQGLVFK